MQDINELTQTLAERLGMENLQFDDEGLCSLLFEDRFTVTLEIDDADNALHLYSNLGKAPEDVIDQLTCFAALLDANLFGRGTAGATLGFEPNSQSLMLSRALALPTLDAETAYTELGRFVQAAGVWSERVAASFWQDADAESPVPDSSFRPLGN